MKKLCAMFLFVLATVPSTVLAESSLAAESLNKTPVWLIIVLVCCTFVISAGIGLAVYKIVVRKKSAK